MCSSSSLVGGTVCITFESKHLLSQIDASCFEDNKARSDARSESHTIVIGVGKVVHSEFSCVAYKEPLCHHGMMWQCHLSGCRGSNNGGAPVVVAAAAAAQWRDDEPVAAVDDGREATIS